MKTIDFFGILKVTITEDFGTDPHPHLDPDPHPHPDLYTKMSQNRNTAVQATIGKQRDDFKNLCAKT